MKSSMTLTIFAGMAGLLVLLTGCVDKIQNASTGLDAGMDAFKAATLSDKEIKEKALQARQHLDSDNTVAAASNAYSKRLDKLVNNLNQYDGLELNFEVYMTSDINAFALADGSIRMYSGLMDMMNDEELLFIVGHEIGHVKLGHHKKALQLAYTASAARKGVAATGGGAGVIAASELGGFSEALINAQFSQSEEKDADDYGLKFMEANNMKGDAAVSSLKKLAGLSNGGHSVLSSHPDPDKRAERIASQL